MTRCIRPSLYALLAIYSIAGHGAVFTNDTTIHPLDFTYDGQDVVVSNCVLTVEGPHNFSSLRVVGSGILTHSGSTNGMVSMFSSVTNESHFLSGTNADPLPNGNVVLASVVIKDFGGTTTYSNSVDYVLSNSQSSVVTVQRTDTSAIPDGANVLVSYDFASVITNAGLFLTVSNNVEVEPAAGIRANGLGYGGGQGSGHGGTVGNPPSGGGGGYGGFGGLSSSNAVGGTPYDLDITPTQLGSSGGGGIGGSGGGSVQLRVGQRLIVNGTISVNGGNGIGSRSGGGSGGSIYVVANSLEGTGIFSANGGAGEPIHGGGGGGGRISVEYATNTFTGPFAAIGGTGWQRGGAGSVFRKVSGTHGAMVFDNGGNVGAFSLLNVGTACDLTVQGRAAAVVSVPQTLDSFLIRSNSSVTVMTNNVNCTFTVISNANVEAGAAISLSGKGFMQNGGLGVGGSSELVGGGAGHGGFGGGAQSGLFVANGGNAYGSSVAPITAGSGGRSVNPSYPAGAGGGVMRLTVAGNLQLDGQLSVDATAGSGTSGGGSGGSIWLTVARLAGSGSISAIGGAGGSASGGGGSGGRVAIYYDSNNFSGIIAAQGGIGFLNGAAGTIFTKASLTTVGDLTLDNGGNKGALTAMDVSPIGNLLILGGTSATSFVQTVSISNFTIGAGASWTMPNFVQATLNISGNAIVASGGGLLGDGLSASSQGVSGSSTSGSAGGAYGGSGGRGSGVIGWPGYGFSFSPSSLGSKGGATTSSVAANGGGALKLNVTGLLTVNGILSANGLNATSNSNGGGSGGSVWLAVGGLSGSGVISANGGSGHLPYGGGGSGGRVAVFFNSNSFNGVFASKGGNGYGVGGAGTIYLKLNSASTATFIADNGGLIGTNTLLDTSSILDLRILGGASVTSSASFFPTINNLTIGTNSAWLAGFSSMNLTLSTADISGWLSLDNASTSSFGQGGSSSSGSGGGGNGGYGGNGAGIFGGSASGSITGPSSAGGRGGAFVQPFPGGGGALRMTINGLLTVNGKISASGGTLITNSFGAGGGAGGSIWITTLGLAGSGTIAANGGDGTPTINGGGGGGRIAIYYSTNIFTGSYLARGGAGYVNGGAGTVYLKANNKSQGQLLVDNGGLPGTNTLWDSSANNLSDVFITGGGAVTSAISSLTLNTLTVGTNSSLLLGSSGIWNITGPVSVASGGAISADSASPLGAGPGGTSTPGAGAGGGGYGGYGGNGVGARGGNSFGLTANPNFSGSQGGAGSGGVQGGAGGGAMHLNITGSLLLNGRISANGGNGATGAAGGGSGGSVWLTVGSISGAGRISADGGSGNLPSAGGGGGGRVALTYTTNLFTGTFSVQGGPGYVRGGAGTIYTKANNDSAAFVLVDNGGLRGTNTTVSGGNTFDLTIQGGAAVSSVGNPRDLLVRTNAFLSQTGGVFIARDATFATGSAFSLDGLGSGMTGGANSPTQAGGGGHGGNGGRSASGSGMTYDSALNPLLAGSPGGNSSGTAGAPLGGAGGGTAHLTVLGTLTIDGQFSASGRDGDLNSGGGAGGGFWLNAGILKGSGSISAAGGRGNGSAGGGAGGRIAVYYTSNLFSGPIFACGGTGFEAGGSGTIYVKDNNQPNGLLTLDNCGAFGAVTPLSQSFGLGQKLTVANGAIGQMQGTIPLLSNLTIFSGGTLTGSATDTNLSLAVAGDVLIAAGGSMNVDGRGFAQQSGPGAGGSVSSEGAGAGYGGAGGASASSAPGGVVYGSNTQPVDRGSGGGFGSGPGVGSQGGGALRLTVSGQLTVDGLLSADGNDGLQDDSGGGSGGSLWIVASKVNGSGSILANGGAGEMFGGGGGGGGRIAIYSPQNNFAGQISMVGGNGSSTGGTGSYYFSPVIPGLIVISQNPQGIISNTVSGMTIGFSSPIDPNSFSGTTRTIVTPSGPLPAGTALLTSAGPSGVNVLFPAQNSPGNYRIEFGPELRDLFGQPMSQVYTGAFAIAIPVIAGTVRDTNGAAVSGVTLQQTDGLLLSTVTDVNGMYQLGVDPGWSGTVMASLPGFTLVPGSRSYPGVTTSISNENYLVLSSITPAITSSIQGTNLVLRWPGIAGINYQAFTSTDLVNWAPYNSVIPGTNGPTVLSVPVDPNDPVRFFRVQASN